MLRLAIAILMLVGATALYGYPKDEVKKHGETRLAQFKCQRFRPPRIHCEAKNVWPIEPIWQVYYPGTEDVVEYDDGIVVYLTLPREKWSRIEMCLSPQQCLVAYGGWFGGKLLFRRAEP